ncbi:ParB/RepB/Spo0J family partition protein [Pseudobacteriovorax antillogorgiicola]|uniref:ParB-like nuclease domain-containing protein n=2 Tax=Pseudobacteriovorax antillogorgiicola TaxID=1513793 RepID=A0A1Y6CZ00_9BACT|nr:ParB N-terminal domain-containing protein [Pseudobacteriovorax antillogorgiicola]TCS41175.1 ParB-like nuclease family protein [Pseudobacteriovorax antillogorgiicola]SMF83909.1 ParB-like nuclease domain-containing protein [Pseudobacteriovorax antillogorgiicola]
MVSISKSASANLENMVKGAGRAVSKSRRKGGRARSASNDKLLNPQLYKKLQAQIEEHGKTLQKIPVDMIDLGENIRTRYDDQKLETLAKSLASDGLIQFPSLCMRQAGDGYRFVCRNGHRRILAAKILGWAHIECAIIPFQSAKEELYHSINANLSEDVFYLDMAHAYDEAARMGEADKEIAERVGMNARTIGWYRRLTKMSAACQNLCRQHPDLFTATWAIKLARQGELPEGAALEEMMQEMVREGKSWLRSNDPRKGKTLKISPAKKRQANQRIRQMFSGRQGQDQAGFAKDLLEQLKDAGYITNQSFDKIFKAFFKENQSAMVKKSLKSRSSSKRA